MLTLGRALAEELARAGVEIDVPDRDTALFRGVPTGSATFSKPRANMLVKRARRGLPYLVCVDEDLSYGGRRPDLARAFASGPVQRGWRVLVTMPGSEDDFQAAVERGLDALGFGEREPHLEPPGVGDGDRTVLEAFGTDLTEAVRDGRDEPTVGREEECRQVLACVLRWSESRLAVLLGDSGVGKSNLLWQVARRLAEERPEARLVSIDLDALTAGTLFDSERENLIASLLDGAGGPEGPVLALEHIEAALLDMPRGASLMARALDHGARLIGTALPRRLRSLGAGPLARRVQVVPLPELGAEETLAVLTALRGTLEAHHGVAIAKALLPVAVRASAELGGCLPARAIMVLDEAASRAALAGADAVSGDDILAAARAVAAGQGGPAP